MHYDLCPISESDSEELWDDNSECADCAMIAAAYDDGYQMGWMDAGQDVMESIRATMNDTAERIYEALLVDEPPFERLSTFLQEFR